jgi:hypothetical protein
MAMDDARLIPTFEMSDQVALEKQALRIFAMPQFQQQKKLIEEQYRQHWIAKTPDGQMGLQNVADTIAFAAVQFALTDDTSQPRLMWAFNAPHTWDGINVPGSGFSNGNPDNIYRIVGIDGASSYEITGQRRGIGPSQAVFMLFTTIPGSEDAHLENQEGAPVIATLTDKDLTFGPDGSFKITINAGSGTPGVAHLQSKPNVKMLMVRDILADWNRHFPNRLSMKRISGPNLTPPSDEVLADRAAAILKAEVSFWLRFFDENNFKKPPNTRETCHGRKGGWGYAMSNSYKMGEGEAVVMRVNPHGSQYQAIQISDPWGITTDYIGRTSGLNNAQTKPNADGTITYVISPIDPGVWNWLDSEGRHMGMWTIRWQHVPVSLTADAVEQIEVVKIKDLKSVLPKETVWVTPEDRKKQLTERKNSYALRLAN